MLRKIPNPSVRSQWTLIAVLGAAALAAYASVPAAAVKVSSFGKYSGYSEAVYDGWVRSSQYVTARDGTRLAIDLFRPTRGGKVAEDKLPVVWTHNRYRRAWLEDGKLITIVDVFPWLQDVLRHGYVVAVLDSRGSGASFGTFQGMFTLEETHDSYDVTEWLAAQPWSNGRIGMYGRSYLGITQTMAAGQEPPHLKAIFPEVAVTDLYALLYHGGIFHRPFIRMWTGLVHQMDVEDPAVPVDEDANGALRAAAVAGHRANRDAATLYASLPFRDSVDPVTGVLPYREWTPITYLSQIRESKVAVYQLAGWFDRYVRDQLILFRNLDNPQKITIGPWSHTQDQDLDFAAEHLRWWDSWLKGIDNGVMKEEPVHYYLMGAPRDEAWHASPTWPPPGTQRTPFYFASGPSGSARSGNDGILSRSAAPPGEDILTVDSSAAMSPDPRWSLETQMPELSANDAKGLTYTTAPLAAELDVVGHPVVHLRLASSAPDADLFIYLEEVDESGASHYITEGALRASNRAVADPGYDVLGLPYHRGDEADRAPLVPGQPVDLAFDLFPTANVFDAGHRIRVTLTGADKANALTPEQSPPPHLTLYRGGEQGSWVELPLLPPR